MRLAAVIAAVLLSVVIGLRLAPHPTGGAHLASGTCYEIYQGTLTPGEPITVCT